MINHDLKHRILEISKKLHLAHIGSCLSILPILEEIYSKKNIEDKVILDGAHSHLAHLVVKEAHEKEIGNILLIDNVQVDSIAEQVIRMFGIHCDIRAGCDASGGSLGHAGGISIGLSIANRHRKVYTIFTDGSISEGSFYEVMRIRNKLKLTNMKCYFNINGYTAVEKIDKKEIVKRIICLCPDAEIRLTTNGKGFEGVAGHYKQL